MNMKPVPADNVVALTPHSSLADAIKIAIRNDIQVIWPWDFWGVTCESGWVLLRYDTWEYTKDFAEGTLATNRDRLNREYWEAQ